jgi:hypothetical protein
MARRPWQLISSEYRRYIARFSQKGVVEQGFLEIFQDDAQTGSNA